MYSDNNNKAKLGESLIYEKLMVVDPDVEWSAFSNRQSREDFILSNGKTVDVKLSHPNKSYKNNAWHFNFHHHNTKQTGIDFYICVAVDGGEAHTFIFPSKLITKHTLAITRKQIARGKFDYFKENWNLIKESM